MTTKRGSSKRILHFKLNHYLSEAMIELLNRNATAIAEICRGRGVIRLDVFGSAARAGEFVAGRSDADFLVEFEDGYGVDAYFGLKSDLEKLLGCPVDIVTKRALEFGPRGRLDKHIAADARLVYGQ